MAGSHLRIYTNGLSINIPRGVPVALFLTNCSNLRDSYAVKTKASENAYVPNVCTAAFTPPSRHYNIGSSHNALQNYKIFWKYKQNYANLNII